MTPKPLCLALAPAGMEEIRALKMITGFVRLDDKDCEEDFCSKVRFTSTCQ